MTESEFEIDQDGVEYKSKTQLKNEMLALQKLGKELVDLGSAALAKMPLDEELRESVELARRINRKKDGFRRQLQFIGKLLRTRDVAPIQEAMDRLKAAHHQSTTEFHHIEQARDKILNEGDEGINSVLEEHPHLDRQKLRQLLRQANKEKKLEKPPKSAREIFQYLKGNIEG